MTRKQITDAFDSNSRLVEIDFSEDAEVLHYDDLNDFADEILEQQKDEQASIIASLQEWGVNDLVINDIKKQFKAFNE